MPDYVESTAHYADAPLALVIGCGGLGTSIARALGRRHALMIVDLDEGRLAQTVATLTHDGYTVVGHRCDITDPAQTRQLGEALTKSAGVRALAHVAAVGMSIGDWHRMIAVDLIGAHLIAEAVGPHMVSGGAAVFISSLASYLPPRNEALETLLAEPRHQGFLQALADLHGTEPDFDWTYNYAKLGVNMLAERLAIEWGPRRVRAVSLSPGMIDSPMARAEGPSLPSHDGTQTRVSRSEKAARDSARPARLDDRDHERGRLSRFGRGELSQRHRHSGRRRAPHGLARQARDRSVSQAVVPLRPLDPVAALITVAMQQIGARVRYSGKRIASSIGLVIAQVPHCRALEAGNF